MECPFLLPPQTLTLSSTEMPTSTTVHRGRDLDATSDAIDEGMSSAPGSVFHLNPRCQ
jgi:hypothetical protein